MVVNHRQLFLPDFAFFDHARDERLFAAVAAQFHALAAEVSTGFLRFVVFLSEVFPFALRAVSGFGRDAWNGGLHRVRSKNSSA